MTDRIIEVVTFKLAEGVSDEDFLKTVPASTKFVSQLSGFIARRLSKGADGTWLEHIEWQSLEAAEAASKEFVKQESLKPMMQAIDGSGAKMGHNRLLVSVG